MYSVFDWKIGMQASNISVVMIEHGDSGDGDDADDDEDELYLWNIWATRLRNMYMYINKYITQ